MEINKKNTANLFWMKGASLFLFFIIVFWMIPQKGMSPVWSVPYFSGALEWSLLEGWMFHPEEVDAYKSLSGWEIYTYKFKSFEQKPLIPYGLNSSGYLYLVWFASLLFPFLGPVGAIVLLQLMVHLFICYVLYKRFNKSLSRFAFLFGYFANPLIIYFMVYPFYYFWQVIPSFVFLFYFLQPKKTDSKYWVHLIMACILFIGFATRNTTVLLIFITWAFLISQKRFAALSLHVGIFLVLLIGWVKWFEHVESYGPWHNAVIGVAAYQNPYKDLSGMNDNIGYSYYNKYSGKTIDASIEGNFTNNLNATKHYYDYMKNEFIAILKENPLLLLRNAFFNFCEGFSIGYIIQGPMMLKWLSVMIGLFVIILLVWQQQYWGLVAIAASHITFSLYYPPIPAYMYGSYLLIICMVIISIKKWWKQKVANSTVSISLHE